MAANPIGMMISDGEILLRREIFNMPGKNNAIAPMFWINPERIPTERDKNPIILGFRPPTFSNTSWEKRSITPVFSIPRPMIMTAIITITALLEKPDSISFGVKIPVHPSTNMQTIATMSIRTISRMSIITVTTRITNTVII